MEGESRYAGLVKHSRENNELTKTSLKTALREMASIKEYKDISVTQLCGKAGVSRMAFYRNYSIVNDVYTELAYDLNQLMLDAVGSPFRVGTSREWYVQVFKIIEENKESMSMMFQENFQSEWMKLVNGLADHDPDFPMEKRFQRIMWVGGFENAVSYWLKRSLSPSAEDMADYCITYLPHLLRTEE